MKKKDALKVLVLLLLAAPAQAQRPQKDVKNMVREDASVLARFATNQPHHASSTMPTEMITAQPAGTLYKNLYRSAKGIFGSLKSGYTMDGYTGDIVMGDDGCLYLKDPLSSLVTNTWLKSEKVEGDVVVFKLPQKINEQINGYTREMESYYLQAMHPSADSSTCVVGDVNEVRFSWKDGKLTRLDPEVIMGLTMEDGTWAYYGDKESTLFTLDDKSASPQHPEQASRYWIWYKGDGGLNSYKYIDVVKENNNVFVKDLDDNVVDGWAKGTIDGDKLTFGKQYLGIDTAGTFHAYLWPVSIKAAPDDLYGIIYDYTPTEATSYNWHADSGKFDTEEGLVINTGRNQIATRTTFYRSKFGPLEDKAVRPSNPVLTGYNGFAYGYGELNFTLPVTDVNGDVMNDENLYYRLYLDDTPYEFSPSDHQNLQKSMTDVPFLFSDNYDFKANGESHTVVWYTTDFTRFGIQAVYKSGGQDNVSDIVYFTDPSGINKTTAGNTEEIKDVTFTDLSGREVMKPSHGLYVKRVTYADGTVKSTKIIKK